ncbi:MAG: asparagine synthase (glutamine-hydrolyzing) [bacterium]
MCGIAGKVCLDGEVDEALLERMCEVIRHRGPDSRGTYIGEGVGLGVQRLAIIDLHTGDQPISNEDGTVVVILNGEIYNYRELRIELERAGHRFRSRSDTEVIVHLYEDLGDECVHRLRGMFAFALWDRPRRRLLVARDRLGKKPLLYSHRGGTLWFGSEGKSILQDQAVPRDVDFDAVDAFLQFGYVPDPLSTFAALRKLPPAHLLTWEHGKLEIRRYWRLSYTPRAAHRTPEDAHEAIREALLEATRLRMRSDVPLGAFLSGGVDSTAVVAAMSMQSSGTVKTFSVGFDVDRFDETGSAREVAELFGTEHSEFRLEPDAVEVLPTLVWHYGEPFADESAIPSLYLAEAARRHVTVALNGDGGDESFAGYDNYWAGMVASRLSWVPASAAGAFRAVTGALAGDPPRFGPVRRARWLAKAATLSQAELSTFMASRFNQRERAALYTEEFKAELERLAPLSAPRVMSHALEGSDAPTPLERFLDADVNTYLPSDLLVKMDIATMAHSLEVRSPLLDHVFMELAAGLPAAMKRRGRTSKVALKDALRTWVPDHILDRPKMGFSVPLADWFRGRLRELPEEVLLDDRSLGRGIFREEAIRALIDHHLAGRADNSRKLWSLLQLELWFRTYIDPAVPAAPVLVVG